MAAAHGVDGVGHALCRTLDERLVRAGDELAVASGHAALTVVGRVEEVHRRRVALVDVVTPREQHVARVAVDVDVPADEAVAVQQPVDVAALRLRVGR